MIALFSIMLLSACSAMNPENADEVYANTPSWYVKKEDRHVVCAPAFYGAVDGWNSVAQLRTYKYEKNIVHVINVSPEQCIEPSMALDPDGISLRVETEKKWVYEDSGVCHMEVFNLILSEKYLKDHTSKGIVVNLSGPRKGVVTIPAFYVEGYVRKLKAVGYMK
ncbi:hypothetical protein [Desulfocurvibacter africanus]|nr:hypothetical protein [Desulfocurvibacter africanus]